MPGVNAVEEVKLAHAGELHLGGITEIYNDAILNTTATFDSVPKTLEEQRAWMLEHDEKHPIIVATLGDHVVGWGSLSPYSDRCCYHDTVEDSLYVRREFRGRGIGGLLLSRIVEEGRSAGHHAIIAKVDGDNEVSLNLHRRMGFEEVGRLREVGFKFGRWLDVVIMELIL